MIRIIHLSDFHLNKQNLDDWNSYIKPALFIQLKNKIDPQNTFIVCTGDLIDKGGKDYPNIKNSFDDFRINVIDSICNEFSLPINHFLIVPGNHDIKRSEDTAIVEAGCKAHFEQNYANVMEFMRNALENGQQEGIRRILPYKNFENTIYQDVINSSKSTFGTAFKYDLNGETVGFSCLNSSWRAYGDDDTNTLIIGEQQLQDCTKYVADCSVKIALVHHPLDWLLLSERSTIQNHIYKDYDLILIGHVHESKTTTQTGFTGSIFINIAPSCTSDIRSNSKAFSNGFTIIEYDKTNKEIDCFYYKYQHSLKEFIINTDIVENGRYSGKIPNPNSSSTKQIIEKSLEFIKQEQYPIMSDHVLAQKANVAKTISEAYVFPPIIDANSTSNKDEILSSLNEITKDRNHFMFFGSQEIGKTTLLYRLVYEYIEEYAHLRKIPIYIDLDNIGNKDIITVIKSYLSCSTEEAKILLSENLIVILIDNMDYIPLKHDKINKILYFLGEYQDVKIIASAKNDMDGILPSSYVSNSKILFKNFFIKAFSTKEIKSLMKIWVPNEEPTRFNDKLDKMVNNFCSYSLPCTAMSVSLFLWGTENSNRQPINQAVLLDICIDLMLDKLAKENIYRATFDYRNKCMLLAKIAQQMRDSDLPNCAVFYSDYIKIIETYLKYDVGYDNYDASIIACYFIERKLFTKISNNQIRFSHSCFFHFFLAKRMEFDPDYREYVLAEENYHNYHKEIDFYSGLTRNDKGLLTTIYQRFQKDFQQLDFVFDQIDIDRFFTYVRKNSSTHETSAKNIDVNKIKSNRPSEEQLDAFYDSKLSQGQKDNIIKREGGVISLEQLLVMMCNVLRNSEGVEDFNLKKEIYNSIIHGSLAWVVMYKELIIYYIKETNQLPAFIPNNINLEYLLKYLPFNMQFGLEHHLVTSKLSSVILQKIKHDITNSKCSNIEAYLSIALYEDMSGNESDKYFKKLIRRLSNNIVRDYCQKKLTYLLYTRTKKGSVKEDTYLDLLTELKIRSQKISRRLTEQVRKSIIDGKKLFISKNK